MLFAGMDIAREKKCSLSVYSPKYSKAYQLHGSSIENFEFSQGFRVEKSPFEFRLRHKLLSWLYRNHRTAGIPVICSSKFYDSPTVGFDNLLRFVNRDATIKGYFQTWRHFRRFSEASPEFSVKIKKPSQDLLNLERSLDNTLVTVIHMRYGDYYSHLDSIGILSQEYFIEATKLLNLEDTKILIFSDDILRARSAISHILPKNSIWIGKEDLSAEESLSLMWRGNQFIISNSSFGYWGAMLAKNPIEIIAPTKWFKGQTDPVDLIPLNWTRVKSSWIS